MVWRAVREQYVFRGNCTEKRPSANLQEQAVSLPGQPGRGHERASWCLSAGERKGEREAAKGRGSHLYERSVSSARPVLAAAGAEVRTPITKATMARLFHAQTPAGLAPSSIGPSSCRCPQQLECAASQPALQISRRAHSTFGFFCERAFCSCCTVA